MTDNIKTDKRMLRFTKEFVGKVKAFDKKNRKWNIVNSYRDVPKGYVKMRRSDIRYYFRSVKQKGLNKGQYCDRCGCFIGKNFRTEISNMWKGFHLCDSCYCDKYYKLPESTPDLEDIKRFKVDIHN